MANNAWIPRTLMRHSSPEMHTSKFNEKGIINPIFRVKALLNKLTEEKALAISLEMKEIFKTSIDTSELRNQVSTSIINKSVREPNYSKIYTELVLSIIEENPDFRISFLLVLQDLFTKLCKNLDSRNRYKQLRGYARLIGEFYNHKLISQKIFFLNVANYFLEELSEDTLGALCVLITVSREQLKKTISGKDSLTLYINKMEEIRQDKSNGISSRMRFLILDVIEDRK